MNLFKELLDSNSNDLCERKFQGSLIQITEEYGLGDVEVMKKIKYNAHKEKCALFLSYLLRLQIDKVKANLWLENEMQKKKMIMRW